MLFLLVLRRRLAGFVALLGRPAPRPRDMRSRIDRSHADQPGTSARTRAVAGCGTPGSPPFWVPALLHVTDGRWAPVLIKLRYERDDPLAVEFVFHGPAGVMARWRFSRDLLLEGMDRIVGQGEVMIWPSAKNAPDRALFLRLGLEERQALLTVRRSPVQHWLSRTLTAVPVGQEMAEVDWDEEQRQLLRAV
ncbi:SsgA family sporulation/cell division regulator [Streptomyces sp. AM 2-1-1]|uniref:SsgA family sporulation/cell division regulator n=1 Tax=Streptomyces sp. AM 2-1-1 TaxID=3028709 RepID=UPI0023B9CD32|nr:SsgA family sporulation/cell division regulator [Streptomyces sp. AM 2-1-1]WEH39213.1 SsgA family sporulation/cell division regulator [Streptomyces sp. AM 2-1-1]